MIRFVVDDPEAFAEERMIEHHPHLAEYARNEAVKLGMDVVPWRNVVACVEFIKRSTQDDVMLDDAERATGRGGLQQLIRFGSSEIYLYIRLGLESGEWPMLPDDGAVRAIPT
jgi:hypothetical protein